MTKIVIVRIKGHIHRKVKVEYAFKLLGLNKPNCCALREETPALIGTLRFLRPFITWGVANEEVTNLFGKEKVLCLNPPRGGYGRKGIKLSFSAGGAYGSRKEKINDLIIRMRIK